MLLEGKVAVVTGAAGGIGEGHARAIAAAGAHVVIADLDEVRGRAVTESLRAHGHEAVFVALDIGSETSVQRMAQETVSAFGKIDYLVNNAALFGGMRLDSLIDMELDYYRHFMNINFHGCLLTTRAVVPFMKAQGGGAIINQSSTAAYMGSGPYSVSKAGVNALTFSLARELGPSKIRVNGIAPGPTDTAALRGMVSNEFIASMIGAMPLARIGTPADIANAAVFLLSDLASWITGHVLNVDGGQWMRI